MQTLLVTGASGFIGTNLIEKLRQLSDVYNVIALGSKDIKGVVSVNHKNYTFSKDDFVAKGLSNIDVLVHLGAFIPKSNAQANDIDSCTANIQNTIHLLMNLPSVPQKIVYISTTDVYDTCEFINENTHTNPSTLYGWSKLYCEKIVENFGSKNDVKVQILRVGHIYGRGEGAYQKIIPNTIKLCLENKNPQIYTQGTELRSFLHVNDCVEAIMNAVDLNDNVGVINIVAGKSMSILETVETIKNKINPNIEINKRGEVKSVRSLTFNADKMVRYLWKPIVPFEKGIEDEINYFMALNG